MAAASCANRPTTSFLFLPPFPAAEARFPRKTLQCAASSASSPSKLRRRTRKNHLRPNILKTLIKPPSTILLEKTPLEEQETPLEVQETPLEEQPPECPTDAEQLSGENLTEFESREVPAGDISGEIGNFSKIPFVKIGLFLLGAFVFQTVCAVWVLGFSDSDDKDGILVKDDKARGLKLGLNGDNNEKSELMINGSGIVNVDESKFAKIREIQAMAREVREKELRESKDDNNNEDLTDDDIAVVKSGIEEEIFGRLVRLRKSSLNSAKKRGVGYLSEDKVGKGDLDVKEANGSLMFKKKYKYRSPVTSSREVSKSFQILDNHNTSKNKNGSVVLDALGTGIVENVSDDVIESLDNDQLLDLPNSDFVENDPLKSEEDGGRKEVKEPLEKIKSTKTARRKTLGKQQGRANVESLDNDQLLDLANAEFLKNDPVNSEENVGMEEPKEKIKSTKTTRKKLVKGKGRTNLELLDNVQILDPPNGDFQENDSVNSEEDGGKKEPEEKITSTKTTKKKLGKGKGRAKLGKAKSLNGVPQDVTYIMPPDKAVKLGESSKIDEPGSPRLTYDQDMSTIANKLDTTIANEVDMLSRDGNLMGKKVGIEGSTKVVNEKSVNQTDPWWLTLPYVLAVVMHTGRDDGPYGLYTIKSNSQTAYDSSCVVAFEDRGDATNFCYLLQSYFGDLEDFTTDIFPIPIKKLEEAVKSQSMKIVVVKKGQLLLYAGQPLADVEMALRSMIVGQN